MELSEERIKEFQEIFRKEYGRELTWEEATESARNLLGLYEVLYEVAEKEFFRKERLKKSPGGFYLEAEHTYTCCVCGQDMPGERVWYDQYGIKCPPCQAAVKKRLIPAASCKSRGSRYSMWEFDYYFGIKAPTIRKFIRQGKLKSRIVPGLAGGKHFEFLLIRDNKGVLPKKPKSFLVWEGKLAHVEYAPVSLPDFMEEVRGKGVSERLELDASSI